MPGLLGFAGQELAQTSGKALLDKMAAGLMHRPFYRQLSTLFDNRIAATHIVAAKSDCPSNVLNYEGIFIWFDGEIYQADRYYSQFDIQPDSQAINPGSHLFLEAYRQGKLLPLLRQVDGIFCAVIYDSNQQQVCIISDRYGLRRLYWMVYQQKLYWFPELKALLGLPGYNPTLNRDAVEDFLGLRYILGKQSFFEGVELLPAATMLTWDITSSALETQRYWWWTELKQEININAISRQSLETELSHHILSSVKSRYQPQDSIGLTLSGGLDSRTLLAAVTANQIPVSCLTYGQANCQDGIIAEQVAELAKAPFHWFEMDAKNWFWPRVKAIWEMDTPCSLVHAQFADPCHYIRSHNLFDINFHGDWGDRLSGQQFFPPERFEFFVRRQLNLDGFARDEGHHQRVLERTRAYFESLGSSSYLFALDGRVRGFNSKDMRISAIEGIETRFPFLDHALQDFLYVIPEDYWGASAIYHHMMIDHFPQFFKTVPYQKTGQPLSKELPKNWLQKRSGRYARKVQKVFSKMLSGQAQKPALKQSKYPTDFADYATWLRQPPTRKFVDELLRSQSPLSAEFVDPNSVQQDWERHLAGEDLADRLGTVITLEIWLRQWFEGQYRDISEVM
jgi:asparagine synthase (glutamine-hydrolysing)